MMNCGVYQITNTVNGNKYVGSSVDISTRWIQHRSDLACNRHANAHLQSAWNKYGADCFGFETILLCEKSMTLYCEQELLEQLKPAYNIALDASAPMLGRKTSDETKLLLSASMIGKPKTEEARANMSAAAMGRPKTDEHKRNLSEAGMGRIVTDETKLLISAGLVGNTNTLGYKHSDEQRRKQSERQNGKHRSDETRASMSAAQKRYWAAKRELEPA